MITNNINFKESEFDYTWSTVGGTVDFLIQKKTTEDLKNQMDVYRNRNKKTEEILETIALSTFFSASFSECLFSNNIHIFVMKIILLAISMKSLSAIHTLRESFPVSIMNSLENQRQVFKQFKIEVLTEICQKGLDYNLFSSEDITTLDPMFYQTAMRIYQFELIIRDLNDPECCLGYDSDEYKLDFSEANILFKQKFKNLSHEKKIEYCNLIRFNLNENKEELDETDQKIYKLICKLAPVTLTDSDSKILSEVIKGFMTEDVESCESSGE
jgi:hypothetical protein